MKCRVYPEGAGSRIVEYALPPGAAAERFALEHCTEKYVNLVVVPADEEARALPGWQEVPGEEDPVFQLYKAQAHVKWYVWYVDTFNPRSSP